MTILNIRKVLKKRTRKAKGEKQLDALEAYLTGDDPKDKRIREKRTEQTAKAKEDVKEFQEKFGYVVNPIAKSAPEKAAAVDYQADAWTDTTRRKTIDGEEIEMGDMMDDWDKERRVRMKQALRASIGSAVDLPRHEDDDDPTLKDDLQDAEDVTLSANPLVFRTPTDYVAGKDKDSAAIVDTSDPLNESEDDRRKRLQRALRGSVDESSQPKKEEKPKKEIKEERKRRRQFGTSQGTGDISSDEVSQSPSATEQNTAKQANGSNKDTNTISNAKKADSVITVNTPVSINNTATANPAKKFVPKPPEVPGINGNSVKGLSNGNSVKSTENQPFPPKFTPVPPPALVRERSGKPDKDKPVTTSATNQTGVPALPKVPDLPQVPKDSTIKPVPPLPAVPTANNTGTKIGTNNGTGTLTAPAKFVPKPPSNPTQNASQSNLNVNTNVASNSNIQPQIPKTPLSPKAPGSTANLQVNVNVNAGQTQQQPNTPMSPQTPGSPTSPLGKSAGDSVKFLPRPPPNKLGAANSSTAAVFSSSSTPKAGDKGKS
jgi:hypothetical protein